MDVLITCPSQRDRNALARIPEHTFHLLDAPLNPRTPSPELDLLAYTDQCREYVHTHPIDAVFYSRDVADIVAAVLCENKAMLEQARPDALKLIVGVDAMGLCAALLGIPSPLGHAAHLGGQAFGCWLVVGGGLRGLDEALHRARSVWRNSK